MLFTYVYSRYLRHNKWRFDVDNTVVDKFSKFGNRYHDNCYYVWILGRRLLVFNSYYIPKVIVTSKLVEVVVVIVTSKLPLY